VDDEVLFLEGVKRLLERHGHRVVTAHNGQEALQALEQGAASFCKVVVTDILMPEMSGVELIEAVKQRYPNLAIVVMSGEVGEDDDDPEWRARGVGAVLRKPVPIERLEHAISRVCA
jgi:CheY-like chemotaxis protein